MHATDATLTQAQIARELDAVQDCLGQPCTDSHRRYLSARHDWLICMQEYGIEIAGPWSDIEAWLARQA